MGEGINSSTVWRSPSQTATLQSAEKFVGLLRSPAAQLQRSPCDFTVVLQRPKASVASGKAPGWQWGLEDKEVDQQAAGWQASLSQWCWGSSPSSEELQDLRGCRSCAVLNQAHVQCPWSTWTLLVALQLAVPTLGLVGVGVCYHCCWSQGRGGPWWTEGLCFLIYPWACVSVLSTYSNRKKWHINVSVKIVKSSLGNGLDCLIEDQIF